MTYGMKKAIYTSKYKTLIARLRQARLDCGINQVQAAKSLGTSQSHISKMESGQRRLDVIQLAEFARLYRKKMAYFLP